MYLDRDKELNMFPTLMDVILYSYDGGIRWLALKFVEHGNKRDRDGVNYLSAFLVPTSYSLLYDKSFPRYEYLYLSEILSEVPIRGTLYLST